MTTLFYSFCTIMAVCSIWFLWLCWHTLHATDLKNDVHSVYAFDEEDW